VTTASVGNGARFAARPVSGGGTPTPLWTGWAHPFPRLDLTGCPGLVVVAPHPDDETLGLGGTIAALTVAGVPVEVVSVSDGGARRTPDYPRWRWLRCGHQSAVARGRTE
jgi:hypothetical protein